MLETEKLDKMFHLLEEMTQSTIGDRKQASWLLITLWRLKWCSGIVLTLIYLALLWRRYGTMPPEFLNELVLGVGFITFYIVFALTFIVNLLCDSWPHKQFVPYMKLSREKAQHRDAEFIKRLLEFDKATLAFGLVQYRHRWSSLQDRSAAFVGDVRKLGVVSVLAALLISVATLKEDSNQFLWVGLVVIVAFFNLMAFAIILFIQRRQLVVQLLEYAIQHADRCNTTPSDTKQMSS